MNAPLPQTITAVPSLTDLFAGGQQFRTDIDNASYHADRSCVSVSGIKQILRSPAHFRWYLDGDERNETPAMFFGTACHARLLEPAVFNAEYFVAPTEDKRTSAYKDFVVKNAGKKILTADQATALDRIAAEVARHQSLSTLLAGGMKEVTLIWQDEETGIWLKIRPDCLSLDFAAGICLDLKTTDDASPDAFARTCINFDYDLQAAAYLEGLRAVFKRDFDFCFAPVEKSEPHGVALYGAPEEMLARGRRRFRNALNLLNECRLSGQWSSYQPDGGYAVLSWPRWAN